ncbi:hypothetical protein D9757_013225 [Collybiopsis confluens]|uniref:ATP-dependent DNA helicase n=1 Tax=Collybiopsis confluens TaxID=2823264 RepID=A0A8H5LKV7_9AGAR|nr:hypothetical protein D9757_013225 [Collybiopsis confluens]
MLSSWHMKNPTLHSDFLLPPPVPAVLPPSLSLPTDDVMPCDETANESSNVNDSTSYSVPIYTHSRFILASLDQKLQIFKHMSSLFPSARVKDLLPIVPLHMNISARHPDGKKKCLADLRSDLLSHQCHYLCLITLSDARSAGFHALSILSETEFQVSVKALRLRLNSHRSQKRKSADDLPSLNVKRSRLNSSYSETPDTAPAFEWNLAPDDDIDAPIHSPDLDGISPPRPPEPKPDPDAWVEILSWDEKSKLLQEAYDAETNYAVKRLECSFCGSLEIEKQTSVIPCSELDITLLDRAVHELREKSRQPVISPFRQETIENDCYRVCHHCKRDIHYDNHQRIGPRRFKNIPVRSYANGLWTGSVPEPLQGLTFLEEQCIARARATKCMFKLELGPSGQYASRGNVCILPQHPGPLLTCLPPPINNLCNEISIILVGSTDTEITIDTLSKTPLLVRRNRIIQALEWLIKHNPLYADLDPNSIEVNSAHYPDHGIPIPLQNVIRVNTNGEGSSYTQQANMEQFNDNVSLVGMPSSTLVDSDSIDSTYRMRKLDALQKLKSGSHSFVKFPSGSTPMSTSHNSKLWGLLWPTLFPYGIGMMENADVRSNGSIGFRKIDFKQHVSHLLQSGPNRRFQTHLSFIFVIGNIIQRRQTSFNAKLAVKRSWFPQVNTLLNAISTSTVETLTEKLKRNPFARADTEGEKAAMTLIRYVNYMADHIPGSMSEVQRMRQDMFSIVNSDGLPHIFLTLNPSDTNNPVAQVLAGRDIDLDKFFHDLKPGTESLERSSQIAQNPVVGAQFFHNTISILLDILLGIKRPNGKGIFGNVSVYYGVVEAQGRGSLHLHLLVWLKHGLSPLDIKDRCDQDPVWAKKLLDWYDDVFSQSIPEKTSSYTRNIGMYKKQPVMSRPLNPSDPSFRPKFNQDLRDLLENTGMIHEHNDTCFKHLPKIIRSLRDDDKDCRFQLPRETQDKTHFDEEGRIVLKCNNGSVNGHNTLIMQSRRCNMDSKPIGSGTVAMAMFQYMGTYTIKFTLDTALVFSALCASIKALSDNPPMDIDGNLDSHEHSRKLLIKTVNKLVGKRELSGQQMASSLIGTPSCYTNRTYIRFYWYGFLKYFDRCVFQPANNTKEFDSKAHDVENMEHDARLTETDPSAPANIISRDDNVMEEDSDDPLIILQPATAESPQSLNNSKRDLLFDDIFLRPDQLNDTCAWDQMRMYAKQDLPQSKSQWKTFLRFQPSHPQYLTHCLKRVTADELPRIPVLTGCPIPRSDRKSDEIKYAVAMLALFKPWGKTEVNVLKDTQTSWVDAFNTWKGALTDASYGKYYIDTMRNMQLFHLSTDARQDYAAMRQKRVAELFKSSGHLISHDEDQDFNEYDPEWENAMQPAVEMSEGGASDVDSMPVDVSIILEATTSTGFYNVNDSGFDSSLKKQFTGRDVCATTHDYEAADRSLRDVLAEKELRISNRLDAATRIHDDIDTRHRRASTQVPRPFSTTIIEEIERTKQLFLREQKKTDSGWDILKPYQKLAIALIQKHGLNERQIVAFLLLAENIGKHIEFPNIDIEPLRMLVTGPGGTGKSRIFEAWTEFHQELGRTHELRLTAPTGVVASDIGGCTVHAEVALRVKRQTMRANTAGGQKVRSELERRLGPLKTLVVDEIYFIDPKDMSLLSEYCSLAKGITEHPFGKLNFVSCGDPAQLPPPGSSPLFDRDLVNCYTSGKLNALNETTQYKVKGILAWHQVNDVVILTEIMRQKGDNTLIDILSRLRVGTCTESDKAILDKYVLNSEECLPETTALVDITRWITDPKFACPLITYTNAARDAHNFEAAKAFARATGQSFYIYHSKDTRGRGKKKLEILGIAAEAAWSVSPKSAHDLGGKVPYVPGMPVFGTENIATELGLSKGSLGTLISITFREHKGRRYAVSALVDFPGFKSGKDPNYPNRVLLKPVSQSFKFSLPNSDRVYSATRDQLPLIPAFAFTSHNSQGRSLDCVCIDLASCRSIQSAYVMLSRVRSLKGLCILRPFGLKKIQNHISQELRAEMDRTEALSQGTLERARESLAWYYQN